MAEKLNLNLEERFTQLQKATERPQTSSPPKIQRVANHLRGRKHFAKHFSPRLVSIGPIHHGDANLQLGEKYKIMWAAMYVESTGQAPQTLHKRIADNIMELKHLFNNDLFTTDQFKEDAIRDRGFQDLDEMLSWMLFVDGCSLLHVLEKAKLDEQNSMHVKVDQLVLVIQDVLLLENQLPYQVLKLLWREQEDNLLEIMKDFLKCHHFSDNRADLTQLEMVCYLPPIHLLDLQRSYILRHPPRNKANQENNRNQNGPEKETDMITYRNIQELKASGIRLKTTKTRSPRHISFSSGWINADLMLPEIVVDDTTATTVLNLIAYEVCPDFKNDYGICTFVAFLDSLIDHPDDVKALRSEGILLNSLGSDEEVANLFNTISADLVPDTQTYSHVRAQIEKHYKTKWKTWIAQGCHTYFSNPWSITALLAAVLALVLTFIQTWFAINPAKS